MRRSSAVLACLTAVALAPAAEAAPTAVAITSPAAGSTVSRAASSSLAVAGTSAFDPAVAADRTFYLRGAGCGATEDLFLSVTKGADDYDGCGVIGGVPLNEVVADPKVLVARDGVPAKLDAARDVAGTIRAESWLGEGLPGVGQVVADVTLSGTTADEEPVTLGSATSETVNTGADGVQLPFTIDLPDALQGVVLTDLVLDVSVRGANYNSSNLGMSGDSKFTLPILDEGAVQVSDSPTFTAARTVTTLPGAGGAWTASLPMPAAGARTVYARAVQGTTRLTAEPVAFTVVP